MPTLLLLLQRRAPPHAAHRNIACCVHCTHPDRVPLPYRQAEAHFVAAALGLRLLGHRRPCGATRPWRPGASGIDNRVARHA